MTPEEVASATWDFGSTGLCSCGLGLLTDNGSLGVGGGTSTLSGNGSLTGGGTSGTEVLMLSEMFSSNEKSCLMISDFCALSPWGGETPACQQHIRPQATILGKQLTFDADDVLFLSLLALRLRLLNGDSIHVLQHARLQTEGVGLRCQEREPDDQQALDQQAATEGKNAEDNMRCEEQGAREDGVLDGQLRSSMDRGRELTVPSLSSLLVWPTCSTGGGAGVAMLLASCCRVREEEVVGNTHVVAT